MTQHTAYPGGQNANRDRVRRYLKANYRDTDGAPLSDARLTELLTNHSEVLDRGVAVASYAHYVGDQIATAAELTFRSED